jgi:3-dehydroquinate dehydratase/shikimate dehydrogenase
LLCSTVTGESTVALRRARDGAVGADLVEVRLDTARDPDADGVLRDRRMPVLVTCRAEWEGGQFKGSEEEREALLRRALDAGADYVDVEWAAPCRERVVARDPARVVVSAHDFTGVPSDLADRVAAMRASGAAVVKVAVMASSLCDQLALIDLASPPGDRTRPCRQVLLAMGEAGLATRVLAERLGNVWTYAGDGVAPGQIPAERLLGEFRFRQITSGWRLYGVVGRPIAHSVSPAMHNAAFAAAGIEAVYLPLAARDFEDFDRFARAVGLAGASVTAPFKLEALRSAATAEDAAARVGAANTLARRPDGDWDARNTDVAGFLAPLAGEALHGCRAVVLGAGGSARSVIEGLLSRGARVAVSARRADAAARLADEWRVAAGPFPPEPGAWDLLVNTTPVGTWPAVDASPIPDAAVRGPLVYDLVYNPGDTALMRAARANGARVIGGLEMLVAQAAGQFEWWTGQAPPVDAMRRAAAAALPGRAGTGSRA